MTSKCQVSVMTSKCQVNATPVYAAMRGHRFIEAFADRADADAKAKETRSRNVTFTPGALRKYNDGYVYSSGRHLCLGSNIPFVEWKDENQENQ